MRRRRTRNTRLPTARASASWCGPMGPSCGGMRMIPEPPLDDPHRGIPGLRCSAKFKGRGGLAQLRFGIHWRWSKTRTGLVLALGIKRRHKLTKQAVASGIGVGVKGSAATLNRIDLGRLFIGKENERVLWRIDQAV